MPLYKYTIFLTIKFVRWLKPSANEERVEDGAFYLHNLIIGVIISILTAEWFIYISNGEKINRSSAKLTAIVIWIVLSFINYFLFFSNEKWKKIEGEFNEKSARKSIINNVLFTLLFVLLIFLFFYKNNLFGLF